MRIPATTALVLTLLAACADITGPRGPAGTYALRSIDGSGPPWWTVYSIGYRETAGRDVYIESTLAFVGDSLRLDEGGTCAVTQVMQHTEIARDFVTGDVLDTTVAAVPSTMSCTFRVTGTAIVVTPDDDGAPREGSIEDGVVTLRIDGAAWRYERVVAPPLGSVTARAPAPSTPAHPARRPPAGTQSPSAWRDR